MIFDNINNSDFYKDNKFSKAFEFLKNNDLENLESGKYTLDGDNVFAIVQAYETKSLSDAEFEAHKKYIDIQYIVKGEEKLGFANIEDFEPSKDYDEAKDIVFGAADGNFLTARTGDFLVFYPHDAHMPGLSTGEVQTVKKVVVKILCHN